MEGEGGDRRLSIYARHFSKKVKLNASKAVIDVNVVYNGKCKLIVQNRNFMKFNDVEVAMAD